MRKVAKLILGSGLVALSLLPWVESRAALEVVEPSALCERFERKNDVQKCMKLVNEQKADAYVASSCDNLEESKLFMKCLEFSTQAEVDPRQLEKCGSDPQMADEARWKCIQGSAGRGASKFQRMPAQFQPKETPRKGGSTSN